jgi:hypothetical protein
MASTPVPVTERERLLISDRLNDPPVRDLLGLQITSPCRCPVRGFVHDDSNGEVSALLRQAELREGVARALREGGDGRLIFTVNNQTRSAIAGLLFDAARADLDQQSSTVFRELRRDVQE